VTRDSSFYQYRRALKEKTTLPGPGEKQNSNSGMACRSFLQQFYL